MKQTYFLIPISPLINLFSLTFIFLLPKPTSCIDPHACTHPRTKTCGDGQNISFPFYVQDKQDSFCGFLGFHLSCNNKGQPILKLENSDYVIQHINYNNHSIRVSNAAVLDTRSTSRLPPIQNISLPEEYRFNLATSQTNLFLLYNCNSTSDVPLKYKVNCSEDGVTGSTLAVFEDDHLLDSVSRKCENVVKVTVDMDGVEGSVQGVKGLLERGFLLNWLASNCGICETSGGKCGFNDTTCNFKCFCLDRPHALHCLPDRIFKNLESGEELGLHQIRNEDENQLARRMIIVGLWCIRTKPSDRPPMSRVIEMLQGSIQPLLIPPRPYLPSIPSYPRRLETDSSTTLGCDCLE